jgi:hypothetical protein
MIQDKEVLKVAMKMSKKEVMEAMMSEEELMGAMKMRRAES